VAAEELEQLVIGRVKARCADPLLREEIVARMEVGRIDAAQAITKKREQIVAEEAALHAEGRRLMEAIGQDGRGGSSHEAGASSWPSASARSRRAWTS